MNPYNKNETVGTMDMKTVKLIILSIKIEPLDVMNTVLMVDTNQAV
jgi:hypothetical protein